MTTNLKGTQTEQNLRAALAGESLARNKYTYYAMKATEEGNTEVAELFETMARNETYHAKVWFQQLYGEMKDSKDNLQEAAGGEYKEWKDMYPSFAQTAREEGLEEGIQQGIEQGLERGAYEKALETAKLLLTYGDSPEKVAICTSLPLDVIQS